MSCNGADARTKSLAITIDMAMAGWQPDQMISGISGIMNLPRPVERVWQVPATS